MKAKLPASSAALAAAVLLVCSNGTMAQRKAEADEPAKPDDQQLLQGTWTITSALWAGRPLPRLEGGTEEFKGDTIVLGGKGKVTYKLRPNEKPPQIDFIDFGGTNRGIYWLRGNRLTFCYSVHEDDERPTEFCSPKEGQILVLIELEREKK